MRRSIGRQRAPEPYPEVQGLPAQDRNALDDLKEEIHCRIEELDAGIRVPNPCISMQETIRKMVHPCERKAGQSCMHHLHCKSEEPAGKRHSFLSRKDKDGEKG